MPEEGEPYWLPSDRTKVIALKIEERMRCNECGTRREEWEEDHNAYHAETERCLGCEKIAWEQQSWRDEATSAYGIKFHLVKPNQLTAARVPDRPT